MKARNTPNTVRISIKGGEITNIEAGFDLSTLGIDNSMELDKVDKILLEDDFNKGKPIKSNHSDVIQIVYRKKTGIRLYPRRSRR